jgi:Phytanoyl-CoA dioxygenase (PhyH)
MGSMTRTRPYTRISLVAPKAITILQSGARQDGRSEFDQPKRKGLVWQSTQTITRLVEEGGIVAPTGKPGSVLMFHGNLVHGSASNITPYPRRIVYLTLCAVSNYIRKPTRPEWIAHRDFAPIEPVPDNALLDHARAYPSQAAAA